MDELFGVLRVHLSAHHRDQYWYGALWELLKAAHKEDEERYFEQWVPYLSALDIWSEAPLASCSDAVSYQSMCKIAPFGRFHFSLEDSVYPEDLYDDDDDDDYDDDDDEDDDDDDDKYIDSVTFNVNFRDLAQVLVMDWEVDGDEPLYFDDCGRRYWPEALMSMALMARLYSLKQLNITPQASLNGVLQRMTPDGFPALECLTIETSHTVDDLQLSLLSQLKSLQVLATSKLSTQALERWLASSSLSGLEVLVLRSDALTDEGVELLLSDASKLPELKRLELVGALTERSVGLLAQSPALAHLECFASPTERADVLFASEHLEDVTQLYVTSFVEWAPEDFPLMAEEFIPVLEGQRAFHAVVGRDEDDWVEVLIGDAPKFKLKSLSLEGIVLSPELLDKLLSHERFSGLEMLSFAIVNDPALHSAYVERLARHSTPWVALGLSLSTPLSAEASTLLATHPSFSRLEGLRVCFASMETLTRWSGVRRLCLSGPDGACGVEVAEQLAAEFGALEWLVIWGDGASLLSRSPRLADALRWSGRGYQCKYPWCE